MFKNIFSRLLGAKNTTLSNEIESVDSIIDKAIAQRELGNLIEAINLFKAALVIDPHNARAANDVGVCLSDRGDHDQAREYFERAYLLDDTYLPAIVNHAKMLADTRRADEAVPLLEQAVITNPNFGHIYSVYAGVCHAQGRAEEARYFHGKAWLDHYDGLRAANAYLFHSSYANISEEDLASEHLFWAETLKPSNVPFVSEEKSIAQLKGCLESGRRIRVGYWSPDVRDHSVRFFLQPLLEGHDKSRFEVFVYSDHFANDQVTEQVKNLAENFRVVYELDDAALAEMFLDDAVDILIELAGHTSNNRLSMLKNRLAPIQISALGYPPTTGLSTIDYKLIDAHIDHPEIGKVMVERPLILPESFWCFKPYWECQIDQQLPCAKYGVFTYGCVGNISKITDELLRSWSKILSGTQNTRLLLRSISFEDISAVREMRRRLVRCGIEDDRVLLLGPEAGQNFLKSYSEIDLVLDTFPFCGGTTTCFATYMGVPVLTLPGRSVVSRMGFSNMSCLGFQELVVEDLEEYVRKAIDLAEDKVYLEYFRSNVRQRYENTALGNPGIYAAHVESAYLRAIDQRLGVADVVGASRGDFSVAPISEMEMMRRAFVVSCANQADAARRIVDYCERIYPGSVGAKIFKAESIRWAEGGQAALKFIDQVIVEGGGALWHEAVLYAVQLQIELGQDEAACANVQKIVDSSLSPIDKDHLELYSACLKYRSIDSDCPSLSSDAERSWLVLVVLDNLDATESRVSEIKSILGDRIPKRAVWRSVLYDQRGGIMSRAALMPDHDFVLVIHESVVDFNPALFDLMGERLAAGYDFVGFAGAGCWRGIEWRKADRGQRAGLFGVRSAGDDDSLTVNFLGKACAMGSEVEVLDGAIFGFKSSATTLPIDSELSGASTLMEEDWIFRSAHAGSRLYVDIGLSVCLEPARMQQNIYEHVGSLLALQARRNFAVFERPAGAVSIPSVRLSRDRFRGVSIALSREEVM